jgi:hypothetical protein
MMAHASIAIAGATATLLTIFECLRRSERWRRIAASAVAFVCLVMLGLMPCYPEPPIAHHKPPPEPTLESRPDIDHVEKLLLAHYRRVKEERGIVDARP